MNKEKLLYLVIGCTILGIGYYFYKSRKNLLKTQEITDKTENSVVEIKKPNLDDTKPNTNTNGGIIEKLTATELSLKLESGCGKKPLTKKNKLLYEKCRLDLTTKLKSQGLV